MSGKTMRTGLAAASAAAVLLFMGFGLRPGAAHARAIPPAALDQAPATGEAVAVFAGGCFWGVQAVFEHVKGVKSATSGYAGGTVRSPSYEAVSSGETGHAESVRVVYDPAVVSYGELLRVFFSVAHDPTQLNRQGPDVGPNYRSAIFYVNEEQRRLAQAYIDQLTKARVFPRPIVTEVAPLRAFYPAEAYHQDYALHHPADPYIVINDAPKVAALRKELPGLYREYDGTRTAAN